MNHRRSNSCTRVTILTRLKGWKYGFESPFKADVYFVTTRLFTGNTWGTSNPVMMRDPDLGAARLRAFGTYDFRVTDILRFLKEAAGTDDRFGLGDFTDTMRSRIVSVFSAALATSHVPVVEAASRYRELGEALLPLINPVLTEKYGLELGQLPPDWARLEVETQRLGDDWLDRGVEDLLLVPSAIVPLERASDRNVLANHRRRAAARIVVSAVTPFTLDPRLFRA